MNIKTRDHKMEWRPTCVVSGPGLGMSFTGLFTARLGQDSITGVSRHIKQ
ncbi:MAG TPA: hypothetical protein VFS76_08850 [Pyrinomonadaceae bacterium]|nr:hypothetical protein [Pyrinomonadaceae bacterium]